MSGILIACGGLLCALGLWARKLAPEFGTVAGVTGLAGGGLVAAWGVAAILGLKGRGWAMVTAGITLIVLVTQTVHVWLESGAALGVRLVVTLMLGVGLALLMYLFHGERPPEYYTTSPSLRGKDSPTSDKTAPGREFARR